MECVRILTVLTIGLALSVSVALGDPYDFTMTTQDYALEVGYYAQATYYTTVTNTGTLADTIDLDLIKQLPTGWFSNICVGGKCFLNHAEVYLEPSEQETVEVEVFTKGTKAFGLVSLTATMRHNPSRKETHTYATFCVLPSILLVDDDDGYEYETYLEDAINDAGFAARVWDADSLGRPDTTQLKSYWSVFWTTADGSASYFTSSDESNLMTYLDGGGNLFLASMGFLSSRSPSTFITDYLKIESWESNVGCATAYGVDGDPISDGMELVLGSTPFSAGGSDAFNLGEGADTLFYSTNGLFGLRVATGGHKIVFLSFPFELASTVDADPNNQVILVKKSILWFQPQAGVTQTKTDRLRVWLGQNFPNPFCGATSIRFEVPCNRAVTLTLYDVEGGLVKTLLKAAKSPETRTVTWDGTDDNGRKVSSGVYFCRLSVGGQTLARKMVMLRR